MKSPLSCSVADLFGWIRTDERLPELGEIVWLWEEFRGPWIGSRDCPDFEGWLWGNAYGTIWRNGQKWDADVEQDDEYKPTHWQPLPLLPCVGVGQKVHVTISQNDRNEPRHE